MNEKQIKLKIYFTLLVVIVLSGCTSGSPAASPTPVASPRLIPSASPTLAWTTTPLPTTLTPSLTPSPTRPTPTLTPVYPTPRLGIYPFAIFSNRLALPDGQYVVYKHRADRGDDFWVITPDGAYQEQLTSVLPLIEEGVFNSDASRLAFITGSGDFPVPHIHRLYTYDLKGDILQEVTAGANCTSPSWAPDGTLLVMECDSSIVVVSLLNGSRTVLASGGDEYNVFYAIPQWSSDGEKIAYIVVPGIINSGIYLMDASCITDPSTCPDFTSSPLVAADYAYVPPMAWSPDGRFLAIGDGGGYTHTSLDVIDIQNDIRQTLVYNISLSGVAWSPDGKWIAYGDGLSIYLVPPEGGEPTLLADDAGIVVSWIRVWSFYVGERLLITPAGVNLNLRDAPALDGAILRQLQPGDVITILAGPVEADGYTWWQMQTADGITGWAVNIPEWYAPVESTETPAP